MKTNLDPSYASQGVRKQTFPIEGMTCAACSARVERVLKKAEGVKAASVNLAAETASVKYDPGVTSPRRLAEIVGKAGYTLREVPAALETRTARRAQENRKQWRKCGLALGFALPLFFLAMAPMIPGGGVLVPPWLRPELNPAAYALAQLLLLCPIVVAGRGIYRSGVKALLGLSPNMDTLVAMGTLAAVLYSLYSTLQIFLGHPHSVHQLYFESAGMIIALVLLGKTMEMVSKGKTSEALERLLSLAPPTAIVAGENGEEREIPADEVALGNIVVVKPGAKIPVDGLVERGFSAVDESVLTGESVPAEKGPGDRVFAGAYNTYGVLYCQTTHVGTDTILRQMAKLVEEAQASKAPIARLADRVSGVFVPVVLGLAVLAFGGWLLAGQTLAFALSVAISVLVIACPCALGLATPTAIMVGSGKGAEHGILLKSGEALEGISRVDTVVFDKTGTLTYGRPEVTDILPAAGFGAETLLELAGRAEKASEHPLGAAIARRAEEAYGTLLPAEAFVALPGLGVEANVEGRTLWVGNARLMDERHVDYGAVQADLSRLAREGKTPMLVAMDGKLAGMVAVADTVRPTSRKAVKTLLAMGVDVVMMTGDNPETAGAIARELGIEKVLAGVLPGGKATEVQGLQAEGKRVAMVGDGVNDAPALAAADVGVAIGAGADIAVESAGIVLMRSDPMSVCAAVQLGRATLRNIRQNLFWAFGYNVAGIPIAAGLLYAFGGPLLNPMLAAAAMSLSSLSVVGNALRLKRWSVGKGK